MHVLELLPSCTFCEFIASILNLYPNAFEMAGLRFDRDACSQGDMLVCEKIFAIQICDCLRLIVDVHCDLCFFPHWC